MRWSVLVVVTFCAMVGLLSGRAVSEEEPTLPELVSPEVVTVSQLTYGPEGTLIVSWESVVTYDAVEFSVDDEPADGEADGTANAARVQAVPGEHVFSVRGVVGERSSAPASVVFTVLEVSPILSPIMNLTCEYLPEQGGRLVLHWDEGQDEWVEGRLQVPRWKSVVSVEAGSTEAVISAAPGVELQVAELTFKNADNYYSPFYTPLCAMRRPTFLRGDCNGNGRLNITDPIYTLNHLFRGGDRWFCDDACDVNDDGVVNISDPIAELHYLFKGGRPPSFPGPWECGQDLTPDLLGGICSCSL